MLNQTKVYCKLKKIVINFENSVFGVTFCRDNPSSQGVNKLWVLISSIHYNFKIKTEIFVNFWQPCFWIGPRLELNHPTASIHLQTKCNENSISSFWDITDTNRHIFFVNNTFPKILYRWVEVRKVKWASKVGNLLSFRIQSTFRTWVSLRVNIGIQ